MSDYELKKHCAARYVYPRRRDLTPTSQKPEARVRITWKQWWEKKFGDNFDDYVKRKVEELRANRSSEDGKSAGVSGDHR